MAKPSVEQRFWSKVIPAGPFECWIWPTKCASGYPKFNDGMGTIAVYRWAYEHLRAPIVPSWLSIDHLCCRRNCVNPWHMEPVTMTENCNRTGRRDRIRKHWARDNRILPEPRADPETGEFPDLGPPTRRFHWASDPGVYTALPTGEVLWQSSAEYGVPMPRIWPERLSDGYPPYVQEEQT